MKQVHRIEKGKLLRLLDEVPFGHVTSSVHVIDTATAKRHELAGVSLYSNSRGWTAQVNWWAVVETDEITLRVGDIASGERAYELRDEYRDPVHVVDEEQGSPMTDEEVSAIVAQSKLAKAWEQDVVTVLKDTRVRRATLH
ncbi:MAG: hypothetical protein J5I81_00690 [Nitrococcus mobilis]|nr:hypothetical protein [Nitrococcus mobilis]